MRRIIQPERLMGDHHTSYLRNIMYCKECGIELNITAKFCIHCGTKNSHNSTNFAVNSKSSNNLTVNKILLDVAINEIKKICDSHIQKNQLAPFFFIIGAGVSTPSIPLSHQIIDNCKLIAGPVKESEIPSQIIDQYSFWLDKAYPTKKLKQEYFEKMIKGKEITAAHLRLAHIISTKKIAHIILTPNFDDLLSRALWLFDVPHITCDHPKMVDRIDPNREEIQVVHVHGSYQFYDICNLKEEIQERAEVLPREITMNEKISHIMQQFSPIVIGYSGWEDDIIMKALYRTLPQTTNNNIYWFCYTEEEIEKLPIWLKYNEHVRFVIPERGIDNNRKPVNFIKSHFKEIDFLAVKDLKYLKWEKKETNLAADIVLDAIVQLFDLPLPSLTEDPLDFYIHHLQNSLPHSSSINKEFDIYLIQSSIERLKRAKALLDEDIETNDVLFEILLNNIRRSNYLYAFTNLKSLNISILRETEQKTLYAALKNSIKKFTPERDLDKAILLYDELIEQFNSSSELDIQELILMLLHTKAATLENLSQFKEAIKIYDEIINRFDSFSDVEIQKSISYALINKGAALWRLKRRKQEIQIYDEIVSRFGSSLEPGIQQTVVHALCNKGTTLWDMKKFEIAINTFDEIFSRYSDSSDLEIQKTVADALFNKGTIHSETKKFQTAIEIYDEIFSRYGNSSDPEIQKTVVDALFNKGGSFRDLNNIEMAIDIYNEIFSRYGDSSDLEIQKTVADALSNKGFILGNAKNPKEEINTYNEIVSRFGNSSEPRILQIVAGSMFNTALTLMRLKQFDIAIETYDKIDSKFGSLLDPNIQNTVARAIFNKGPVFGRLKRPDEEIKTYNEIISRFGTTSDLALQTIVADSLINKAYTLAKMKNFEMAINTYDEIISRFGASSDRKSQIAVANALYSKGISLEEMNRKKDAIIVYETLISQYKSINKTPIKKIVNDARDSIKQIQMK